MAGGGPPRDAADLDPVVAEVGERERREVGDDVGVQVGARVVHLVEQLLAHGVERDHAAGRRRLRDDGGAVGLDLGDREADAQRVRVLPPRSRVVAAGDLARALEQVADDDAGGEPVPVVPRPAVLVDERGEEQRRVGDATGDDDVGALPPAPRRSAGRRGRRWRTACPAAGASSSASGRTSSPTTVATVSPAAPAAFSVSTTARPAATGLMPPALVMNFVRPSTTNGSAARRYAGRSRV